MTDAWVFAAALAGLPGMTGRRLTRLLQDHGDARHAWSAVMVGQEGLVWAAEARLEHLADIEAGHRAAGVSVTLKGEARYPTRLAGDHQAPPVVFVRGRLDAVGVEPAVAIVGTRRSTHAGREVAADLGRELAAAGVCVVSGLALGIDGAAHEGALAAGGAAPVAVVGSGLDVVYPERHRSLWERVAAAGALVSEVPLGVRPARWRFPMRNRILAALADAVVVVESGRAGGSMHTVAAASSRGVPVLAVPGSVRSPASAGTNELLAEGCPPARDATDVLVAMGLRGTVVPLRSAAQREDGLPGAGPEGVDGEVLAAVDWAPTTVDRVVARTGCAPQRVAAALVRLEALGLVRGDRGWWERQKVPDWGLHS